MSKRIEMAPEQVITGFGERLSTLRKAAGFTHHLKRVVQAFKHLVQRAVDQTVAEIKHGLDCRLRLTQQNPQWSVPTRAQRNLDGRAGTNHLASRVWEVLDKLRVRWWVS